MKKGLLVIYSPQHLIQFIWYYCTYGHNKKWDALCLPNGFSAERIKEYCEKTGIFEDVFFNDTYYMETPLKKRIAMFSKMLTSSAAGKKKQYVEKFLSNYVELKSYDEINVLSDFGIISGAFTALSKEKQIIIMEDGVADYQERTFRNIYRQPINTVNFEGLLLSLLGYANVAHYYPLRTNKDCIKFSSRPKMMKYRDYKGINKLYDFGKTDMSLYNQLVKTTYFGASDAVPFEKADAILFTNPISDFTSKPNKYINLVEEYISEKYNNILIKKHPRDKAQYTFSDTSCYYIPQPVPSEALFPYLSGKKLIFAAPSSILLNITAEAEIECLYFKDLYKDSIRNNSNEKYNDFESFCEKLSLFGLKNISITKL